MIELILFSGYIFVIIYTYLSLTNNEKINTVNKDNNEDKNIQTENTFYLNKNTKNQLEKIIDTEIKKMLKNEVDKNLEKEINKKLKEEVNKNLDKEIDKRLKNEKKNIVNDKWNCVVYNNKKQCIKSPNGHYNSKTDCKNNCKNEEVNKLEYYYLPTKDYKNCSILNLEDKYKIDKGIVYVRNLKKQKDIREVLKDEYYRNN